MTQALELASLQVIDNEVTLLRSSAAEVARRLEADEELLVVRDRLATAADTLAELRKRSRKLEGDAADLTAHIDREEQKLYGGTVKNPKELATLQHEVDGLKAQRTTIEDGLIEQLAEIEKLAGEHDALQADVTSLEARWVAQSKTFKSEAKRIDGLIARSEALRVVQAAKVDPRVLRNYQTLRGRKSGDIVVHVKGNTCGGCRVGLPDAVRRKVVTSLEPIQCPHCERILVMG